MRLTFLGAAREVTGTCILVEVENGRILLECGFFQGSSLAESRNYAPFAFDPKTIDAVVVCHAHLDHTGRLPKLVSDGFGGKIYSTAPTKELTQLVLEDSAKLMIEESRRDKHKPLYTQKEIEQAMQLFETISYDQTLEIIEGLTITFKNAGHILGSAICVLECEGKKTVYSSDLGNQPAELLSPPAIVERADYVIMETTYGSRVHEDVSRRHTKVNEIINRTIASDGVLLIPTFAIERAQELLHDIEHFCTVGNCAIPTFFLDSPLAQKVTTVFEKYKEFLNPTLKKAHGPNGDIFGLERLTITATVEQSKSIDDAQSPKIIIAGSGMLNGGRILFHLQKYIEDAKNTLLIVGYQGRGTLGRRLLEGAREVKIFGRKYQVKLTVVAISSYSAHADAPQLLDWLSKISRVKKVFLVHGESNEALVFSKTVHDKLNLATIIPQQGEGWEL